MTKAARTVLVVEDSPEDFEAVARAIGSSGVDAEVRRCESGEAALDYLRRSGEFADAPRPTIVLLDLNLPGMNGTEVVEQCKSDESLRSIPVVILTSSLDGRDVRNCYESGANSYIQKPMAHGELVAIVERIGRYWFDTVVLPEEQRASWPKA